MKKGKISLALVLMLVVATVTNTLFAAPTIDTSAKGSLTIIAKAVLNGDANDVSLLQGVEYTLYSVAETVDTVTAAETAIAGTTAVGTQTTDENGEVTFSNLTLGRYYAKVTGIPAGASEIPESFLVDVPMTNDAGTDWVYDITATPKVQTAAGDVTLQLQDASGNALSGYGFKLQVKTDKTAWTDFQTGTTDSNGQIVVKSLPIRYTDEEFATYRFVQTAVPSGYINDNKYVANFVVNADGTVTVTDTRTNTESTSENPTILVVNETTTLTAKVNNLDQVSASLTDTMTVVLTADLPSQNVTSDMKTYTITDVIDVGLARVAGSVKITGILRDASNTTETVSTSAYTTSESGQYLNVYFTPSEVAKYSTLKIEYQVKLDADNFDAAFTPEYNEKATLSYSNNILVDGTASETAVKTDATKVLTGGIVIKKVDKADSTILLSGAQFKIATSEANAKAGTYVKGTDGQDIVLTTNDSGKVSYYGLAYENDGTDRNYYLVEVKAPTYTTEENGETVVKEYNLLKSPVEVAVGSTSHNSTVTVQNAKKIALPATGGIGIAIFAVIGLSVMAMSVVSNKKAQVRG